MPASPKQAWDLVLVSFCPERQDYQSCLITSNSFKRHKVRVQGHGFKAIPLSENPYVSQKTVKEMKFGATFSQYFFCRIISLAFQTILCDDTYLVYLFSSIILSLA